ncbi:MAG: UDP-N-acetylmuramoyl-L-alanyl-D-glutamate--2,6-diaminopimelate ligase [candidate division Zixibacteria bacterium]
MCSCIRRKSRIDVQTKYRSVIILLRDLARAVSGAEITGNDDVEISGIEYHSGMIKPGSAFVAITGFQQDGNLFAQDAIEKGAVAIITEKEGDYSVPQMIVPDTRMALADLSALIYDYEKNKIKICAVTGTNGKTTSCFLIRNILNARGKRTGLVTSLVYDTLRDQITASRTTPESLDIFRLLTAMKNNFCTNTVIEVSSHALMLHRIRNLNIQVALFTNFTREHLDFHKDMNDYLEAKAKLLDFVTSKTQWAVLNYDCPEFRGFLDRLTCSHMTYSLSDPGADVYLEHFELRPDGSSLELRTPMGVKHIDFKLPGRYNLYNALAAATASLASGVDIDSVATGLANSRVIPGRLERIESNAPFSVFIDYAHTPDALKRTIETLKEIGTGRVLTLFGCGGDRDRGKRPLMAEAVALSSDYCVLTSDNPRSEDPQQIINDAQAGFTNGARAEIIKDREEAIKHILENSEQGDIILLAGKGAEEYQEINGVRYPFSDKDVAIKYLEKMRHGR